MKQAQTVTSSLPMTLQLERLFTQDWVLALLLLILGLVSRIPFQSQILYHWDSVNFAFAIREFNVAKEQPQPPGYIVYVWLSRLLDSLIGDAQTTLVTISIVASTLAVIALFFLGKTMFNRQTGLIAALFLATSPLFWFYSEIALPHTVDTLLIIVTVWWLYETMRGNTNYLYPAIVSLAVAGGVRQQTLVFLIPLLLFALRRVGWKHFLTAGLVGMVICLGWFIPLMVLSDGISNYMWVMGKFSDRFQSTTSIFAGAGWWGLRRNLIKLIMYTLYGWSSALLPVMIYLAVRTWQKAWPRHWEKLIFLSLWMLPTLIFYALIHMGQQGLVFVFLPALLLLGAAGLSHLLADQTYRLAAAAIILVAINGGIFHLVPEYPLGPDGQRLLTRDALLNSDRYYQARLNFIQENFEPESTVIVAANWHHLDHYLPEGAAINEAGTALIATTAELGLEPGSDGLATVVIFDPELMSFNHTPDLTQEVTLPGGESLQYLKLNADDRLQVKADSFGLEPK
jgi:asparagine N-glycosylation enzyme membrane subunit Stt3